MRGITAVIASHSDEKSRIGRRGNLTALPVILSAAKDLAPHVILSAAKDIGVV